MLDLPPPVRVLVLCCVLGLGAHAYADPVRGAVLDGNTLRPVAGASITVARPPGAAGRPPLSAKSDARGLYELDLPRGKHAITVRARSFAPTEETLDVPAGGLPDHVFFMVSDDGAGEVIEIVVESPIPPPPGRQDLGREVITRIPGTRGDALQSVKSLPGVGNVNANGPGASNIVIRGAAPEDSKVMVDGVEVPLLYHFGGLQSFIPSEFIQNIEFVPGGFGVEEGRSTGGVINVVTRTDAVAKPEGFVEFSFINLAALVQAPVNKQKTAFISAAVRRSAIDFILPLIPIDLKFVTAPKYYDAQTRFVWTPSARHRVSAFGFLSIDKLGLITEQLDPNEPDFTGQFDFSTEFYRLIGSWAYAREDLNNRLTLSGGTTKFGFNLGATNSLETVTDQIELRNDTGVKLSEYVTLRFGANGRLDYRDLFATLPALPGEGELPTGNFSDGPRLEYDQKFTYHVGAGYAAADVRPSQGHRGYRGRAPRLLRPPVRGRGAAAAGAVARARQRLDLAPGRGAVLAWP
ncbi:MAG: TonB-dependent receptor plug domain-containing protein [Myxococcales bacterium]|nr:TonB-dependent receptor plug domain-containing protein [Myxococcales bacterium]